jgi:minor extracellular serine protease Vpr
MRMRRRPELARTTSLAAVAAAATILLLAGTVQGAGESVARVAARAWYSIFGERPAPTFGHRMIVVLSSPSVAERAAGLARKPTAAEQREWVADIEGTQQSVLAALRLRGADIHRELTFTRVLDGFSARLDARALAELQRNPLVVGVYPVRAVYPAEAQTTLRPGTSPQLTLAGATGRGVTVALLDTGVDRSHPDLTGRIARGYDLVAGDDLAAAEASPDDSARLETHGTRMAGLIAHVAPRARVIPLRILGWQKTDAGYSVVGRGDVLVAGLERAVDPNGDGVASDAADIALAPVVEPFAAFTDSPEARAVTGATELGTLVVAPSGNDGDSGSAFGTVGAPGSAPDSLSVGALDTRPDVLETQARLAVDNSIVLDEAARLLGSVGPSDTQALAVAGLLGPSLADPTRASGVEASGAQLGDFFDPNGISRVAGRAALVPADGTSLERKAANAKAAGATALLVYGTDLPAGALDLDEAGALPVVALPGEAGAKASDGLRHGEQVSVVLSATRPVGNGSAGAVAPFSSGGLAFDGRVRPDLVAPGVGLATDDARAHASDQPRYATATGSSAAAAVAAGAAALVKEARPALSARELRSVLVGSASLLGESVTREGAGVVDVAAAGEAELAVTPATLAFGRAGGARWNESRTIAVKNVSSRALEIGFAFVSDRVGETPVTFTAQPAHLNLGPGASADVSIGVSAAGPVGTGASGVLLATAPGSSPARIPWAIASRPANRDLVRSLALSNWEFEPSSSAPSVLAFTAGWAGPGGSLEPVGVLDVELWTTAGERLGLIARLHDLLPGRYAFGLTGRDANGRILPAGMYVLRLRAQPVDAAEGAPPMSVETVVRIKEHA